MNKEEELIDRLIDLDFRRRYRRWRPYNPFVHSCYGNGQVKLLIKEPGILAGIEISKVFRRFDPTHEGGSVH